MKIITLLVMGIAFFSCASQKNIHQETILVDSKKTDCMGMVMMKCMSIKHLNKKDAKWEPLFGKIEGFTYEEGFTYKLKVSIEKLPDHLVPADASNLKYKLIDVLNKTKEEVITEKESKITDKKWNLTHLESEKIAKKSDKRPTLYFEIKGKNNAISGVGACNNFSSVVEKLNNTEFIVADRMITTRMGCMDNNLEYRYFQKLVAAKTYTLKNNQLYLLDKDNKEILRFSN
ncbi:heat shock protein HslJ [Lutibacter sp. Hel_I_33_5]|uniref:DUF4377 domain-containing protein n=1 Tax=Lutibacter sp. Hel_I_33_5 TaxID=1566289 RepID=UPI0011A98854|nr:DUF4377 domain-containing protein [Lutibacter sp. Hel_I_33_5]TVZ56385.1 heat shock protein HslJ [Lutibacter sp. Hel_I_33_5]